jgi:hypothetical protein
MTAKATARNGTPRNGTQADGEAPKIISLRSRTDRDAEPRIPCFEIDSVVYTIAAKVATNTALKYAHIGRTQGQDAAVDYMLGVVLGEDGYAALREFDDLEEDDLTAIINGANQIMQGALEAPKGKRSRG